MLDEPEASEIQHPDDHEPEIYEHWNLGGQEPGVSRTQDPVIQEPDISDIRHPGRHEPEIPDQTNPEPDVPEPDEPEPDIPEPEPEHPRPASGNQTPHGPDPYAA